MPKTQLSRIVQSGRFIPIIDKIIGPTLGLEFEVLSMNHVKSKSFPKVLLDAGYNFIDHKTNMKPSSLFRFWTNANKQWDKSYCKSN